MAINEVIWNNNNIDSNNWLFSTVKLSETDAKFY